MANGIFEEYYRQVAIIACVHKFSVQKARKGADKVTLLLLQEPKNARIEKDNNQEFEKRVSESQDMQKLEIFTEFFHLSLWCPDIFM